MPPPPKQVFWQRFRRCFRWCRITLLLFVLLFLGSLVYLNRVGLPEFLKARLVSELRARGVVLQFTRMRLRWYHGLVAENVSLGPADEPTGPRLSIGEADLKFDRAALYKLHLQIKSLTLHDGRLVVPLVSTNEAPEQFLVNNIMTELHLLPDDQWQLDHFQARCLGARVDLSGTLANASAVRNWRLSRTTNQPPGLWTTRLREVVKIARQMRFSRPPEILLRLQGDAREPGRLAADLRLAARGADTAWGRLDKLLLIAKLNHPSGSNDLGASELKLQLDGARTPWGQAKLSRLYLHWAQSFTNPMPAEAKLDWELSEVDTPWGRIPEARFSGSSLRTLEDRDVFKTELALDSGLLESEWFQLKTNRFTAQLVHSPDNLLPRQADWQWTVERPHSRWGEARRFQLNGHATRAATNALPGADPSWAWWAALEPFDIDWESQIDGVTLTNVMVDRIDLAGQWRAPELAIQKFHADLYGHQFDASVQTRIATRETRAQGRFDFDVRKLQSLLTPDTGRWLSQYSWTGPPKVRAEARVILPAWTNAHPDWRAEVLPTLRLEGELHAGPSAFRGVPISSAHSHFSFSNFVWQLPDFVATRPEGRVEFACASDIRNHDYRFKLRAQLDPLALKPLFLEKQATAFDYFHFNEPLVVEGEVRGQWRDPEKFGATGRVTATNFVFREVPIGEFSAAVTFTNRFLAATEVMVGGGGPRVSVGGVGYDLATQTVYLTNALSTMDPKLITHAIGPRTEHTLSPYTFVTPPTARVNGWAEVRRGKHSDMRFELAGGPFTYWKFNVPQVSAVVRWADETVTVTNLQADFYRGKLAANLYFDCTVPRAADFNLHAQVTDAGLRQLMADISSPTNRLEGTLSGDLTITRANTGNWESWNGFGNAKLRDGFLWDMPLFGIFSPVLNAVIPGLGSSRVSGGTATFAITNSVIHTDDMEIRSPAMRLAYRGTIDFKGGVDAHVEARLLRDAWVIGPIVSLVFSPLTKLFEYKVTGTLREPQKEPLYIPREFLFPFHPFRTLKELFSEEKSDKPNPPPPAEKPPQQ
ncbi:MAG TPA: AsmA-like C-terminal region-containing protein [Haliangiales bacterium]|nr:AsmA-like C-terminal region-containing protein [Haliangiales bacterium]